MPTETISEIASSSSVSSKKSPETEPCIFPPIPIQNKKTKYVEKYKTKPSPIDSC